MLKTAEKKKSDLGNIKLVEKKEKLVASAE